MQGRWSGAIMSAVTSWAALAARPIPGERLLATA
jgi:hypothetical protein